MHPSVRPLVALLLLSAGLAGCVGSEDPDAPGAVVPASLQAPAFTPLSVTLEASQAWLRPGEEVTLTAGTTEASAFSWFLAPTPAAKADGGHAHHGGGADAAASLDTGELQPGTYSEPLTLEAAGLYRFHCHPHPWMTFDAIVREGASASGIQHVAIVDGDAKETFRFVPQELEVAPGAQIVFWNNGTIVHTATQDTFAETLPGEGATITLTPETAGAFDVLVLARDDAMGRGEARASLLVDAQKPDEAMAIGPFEGGFDAALPLPPEAHAPETKDFPFSSEFPMLTLSASIEATSGAPVPIEATLQLLTSDGQELAATSPGASGTLETADLEPGDYVLRVTANQGAMVTYTVTGTATLDLSTPPEQAAEDPHAGHH